MQVITLVLVLLMADGATVTTSRQTATMQECKARQADAHKAAAQSFDVMDVGTICLQSDFDLSVKPAA